MLNEHTTFSLAVGPALDLAFQMNSANVRKQVRNVRRMSAMGLLAAAAAAAYTA
jgi:hypothetical protein